MNIFPDGVSAATIMSGVASSTTSSIASFAPLFYTMAGIILAVALISWLISLFSHTGQNMDFNDTIPDDMI